MITKQGDKGGGKGVEVREDGGVVLGVQVHRINFLLVYKLLKWGACKPGA